MIYISEDNVKSILEMIEDLVLNSAKIPILNKLIIDEDKLFGLLDELNKNLPAEMTESKEIVENKEKIINDATNRAKEVLTSAEMRAKVLVSNSEVLKKALLEVDALKYEANKELEAKNQDVDRYADAILENLENQITNAISVIKNGKEKLSQS